MHFHNCSKNPKTMTLHLGWQRLWETPRFHQTPMNISSIKKKDWNFSLNIKANSNSPQCSPCSLIVISDHTAHDTHEWSIFSLYAISCAVLMLILILYSVMGVMITKWEMFFLLLSPIYPSFSHCILPENISQARSLQPNFTKYCSGYLSS